MARGVLNSRPPDLEKSILTSVPRSFATSLKTLIASLWIRQGCEEKKPGNIIYYHLNEHCNTSYLYNSFKGSVSNPSGLLINRLNYFRIRFRFRIDIRSKSLKILIPGWNWHFKSIWSSMNTAVCSPTTGFIWLFL